MRSFWTKRASVFALLLSGIGSGALAQAQLGSEVPNWTVPEHATRSVDLSRPATFVAMTPCRVVDTRYPAGPYGGPILPPNTERSFDINSGPCAGIPPIVAAYSLNFTVTQTQGPGDIRVWPREGAAPLVSTLNYLANQTLANAAIVPAGTGGITVIAAASGTHLIIDINGYFTSIHNQGNTLFHVVTAPNNPAVNVKNSAQIASISHGIYAETDSSGTGSFGVVGGNFFASGESGGVRGSSGGGFMQPSNYGTTGVSGTNATSFGVLGVTRDHFGVAGSNVGTNGLEQTWGGLACSDIQAVCGMGTLNVSGSKSFVEPHPTDASKVIKYVSLEGNEAGTYFRGRARFERGLARIRVPEDFRMVTDAEGLSIQVTPIGEMAGVAVVRIDLNEIVVKASRNVEFFYTVNGVRKGYEEFLPISEENFFMPRSADYQMPEGLSAEAKRKLIANGTYNKDGTVNMETAERLGWTANWEGPEVPKKE